MDTDIQPEVGKITQLQQSLIFAISAYLWMTNVQTGWTIAMETHYDFLCSIVQYLILITGLNIPFPSRSGYALYEFDIGN